MRNFKKGLKIGALIVIAALVVAQFIRIDKSNPPIRAEISTDPAVKPLLKRACYNCHSNETVWPWYSSVAPASWLLASDVNGGRAEVNFSEWGAYTAEKQSQKLKAIAEEVEQGEMPPWYYSIFHSESRLTPEDRRLITNWASGAPASAQELQQ